MIPKLERDTTSTTNITNIKHECGMLTLVGREAQISPTGMDFRNSRELLSSPICRVFFFTYGFQMSTQHIKEEDDS